MIYGTRGGGLSWWVRSRCRSRVSPNPTNCPLAAVAEVAEAPQVAVAPQVVVAMVVTLLVVFVELPFDII